MESNTLRIDVSRDYVKLLSTFCTINGHAIEKFAEFFYLYVLVLPGVLRMSELRIF